jgi:hypothetical protein
MTLRLKAWLLFLTTFALYLGTRSYWLDEWDSVQFALGLDNFNLWNHQPHPPGYPVYIFAGKLLVALGMSPVGALVLIGCLSGAALIALWFLIVQHAFDERLAWLIALTTAFTPGIWMTATKAVTDVPAAAALSWAVLFALKARHSGRLRDLSIMAFAAALATGLRPQFIGVALVLVVTALILTRSRVRAWGLTLCVFLLGNSLWLAPTCILQARTAQSHGSVMAYPNQLLKQWRWRLDKPTVFIGAGGLQADRVEARIRSHVGGWVRNGFGIRPGRQHKLMRWGLFAAMILTLIRQRRHPFWKMQLPWAITLILIVFCCLPEDRRYYVAVAPLIWIAALGGLWEIPRWRLLALLAPLLMLGVGLPLALAGHREPPPPVQMIQHLQRLYPPEERSGVCLLLSDSKRHGEWYAPDFLVAQARAEVVGRRTFRNARAFYTDQPNLQLHNRLRECRMEEVATFTRDSAIYPKHSTVRLFRIYRPGEVPTLGK